MVKQYVGARYVPKFASPVEWAADTSYEALTIVTFNNASYTSKVPVPPTVGNPANNPQYWALTGNYNAQVEQYRQETENYNAQVKQYRQETENYNAQVEQYRQETENYNAQVEQYRQETENYNAQVEQYRQEVEEKTDNLKNIIKGNYYNVKKVSNRYFLFCGDSYGAGELGYSWPNYVASFLGITSEQYANACVSGAPFWNHAYLTQLQNFTGDKEKVTDILLCAGANDIAYESQSITEDATTALKEFINYAHANYPNANVYLGMIGTRRNSEGTTGKGLATHWWNIVQSYETACAEAHATYLSNVETIWSRGGAMGIADGIHPTDGGMQYIALAIAIAWSGIRYTNIERDTLSYTPINTDKSLTLIRSIYDGTYTLLNNIVSDVHFNTVTKVDISGTKIGEMTDAYINTPVFVNIPVIYNTDSGNKMGQSFIELNGKDIILGINEIEGDLWKQINATGFQITQFQISFPIMYAI